MHRHVSTARSALFLAFALCGANAHAALFCVGNTTQLNAAIIAAEQNGQSDDIRLQIGVYTGAVDFYTNAPSDTGSLTISGGWLGFIQACDTQFPDASLTRIDENQGLRLTLQGATPGALTISNMSITNSSSASFESAGIGIGIVAGAPQVTINNVVVRGCRSTDGGCGISTFGPARVLIRNVLVTDNHTEKSSGIFVNGNNVGPIQINHATVTGNSSFFGNYPGIVVQSTVKAVVSNSILWDNLGEATTDCDIAAPTTAIQVVNSIVQQSCPGALDPTSAGVMNVDPQFADGDGNFRLKDQSPARDAGVVTPAGGLVNVDLDGRSRTLGANPDLGPFENTSLFATGFE